MSNAHTLQTPVTKTLNHHVTIRAFKPDPIDDTLLLSILNAARRSPTSSNRQTYSVIVVKNPDTKKQLAVLAGNQKHVQDCPVFLAFCADIHRLAAACTMHGVTMANSLENTLVSTIDAAMVGMSTQSAAESFGLGGVMIGGMRNHPKEVAELLGLPQGVYVVYGMCLGWPDETRIPPQKPRLPQELIIHQERYDTSDLRNALATHDQELAHHYESQGRNLAEAAWTGPIAKALTEVRRPELRRVLEELGFSFD